MQATPAGAVTIPGSVGAAPEAMSSAQSGVASGGRLPAPAFGSSPNLQALALDTSTEPSLESRTFQEITVVSADQPKLLSRLSEVMVRGRRRRPGRRSPCRHCAP